MSERNEMNGIRNVSGKLIFLALLHQVLNEKKTFFQYKDASILNLGLQLCDPMKHDIGKV